MSCCFSSQCDVNPLIAVFFLFGFCTVLDVIDERFWNLTTIPVQFLQEDGVGLLFMVMWP